MQTVKLGVQYSLWGGSVVNLGTERHRKKYFDDIDRFRLPGGWVGGGGGGVV
jgi:acyl-CoA oxidase